MNTQIDFNDIPKNYLYCTHNKCPRHSKCLRYQAALCIPQTTPYYSAVNPSHIAGNETTVLFSVRSALSSLPPAWTICSITFRMPWPSPYAKKCTP